MCTLWEAQLLKKGGIGEIQPPSESHLMHHLNLRHHHHIITSACHHRHNRHMWLRLLLHIVPR